MEVYITLKKRLISIIITLSLSLIFLPAISNASNDSADTWAREGIASALNKGFVPEDLQSDYKQVVTRAEFCRLAVKWLEYALGKDIETILEEKGLSRKNETFSDTHDSYILAAYALGITGGTEAPTTERPGRFTPDGQFDRQQAATMIMNTCRAIGADVDNPAVSVFEDINKASAWARNGIDFVYAHDIMRGTSVTPLLFSPTAVYDRQQSIITFNNINLFKLSSIGPLVRGFTDENTEILLVADNDMVIERDKYILYLQKGDIYSNKTIKYFDLCIDMVEEISGLSMNNKVYTNKIRIYTDAELHAYAAGTDDIHLNKIENLVIGNFAAVHVVSHEMAHLLHRRYYPSSMRSLVVSEGFAELVCSLVNDRLGVANFNDHSNLWMSDKTEAEFIKTIETSLAELLASDVRYDLYDPHFNLAYQYGYAIMQYIYQNFGMDTVVRCIANMEQTPGTHNYVRVISSVIGEDFSVSFPAWYHANRGIYFQIESLLEMTKRNGFYYTYGTINLEGKYNYIPILNKYNKEYFPLNFHLSGNVLIDFREGKKYMELTGYTFTPNRLIIGSPKPVVVYLYDNEDRLVMEIKTTDYNELIPDIDYMIFSGEGEIMFRFIEYSTLH